MAGRFVRASKYRHVFGQSTKKEQCYDNLRISKNAWDSNLIKANPKYISVNIESSGGGAFAVIPINERGRAPEAMPLFRGHTAAVLDTDWNPFNDSIVASGSDDGKVFIWQVPEDFTLHTDAEEPADVSPVARLTGHTRKVGHVLFNPAVNNILASSSGDYTIKLWDIETGSAKLALKHGDIVQSMSWNATGSLMVTTSRDKKLRVWDVRQEKPAQEAPGHAGAKNSRAVWMGEHDRVATTGFSRMSDRQLGLWDIRAPKEPINGFQILDSISGVCMPFWDDGTQCLYLAGKGDGNIRYFEYENDKFEFLSEYTSPNPQRGIAFLPKRGVNVHQNEVMRCFKTVNDSFIEPISFIVPRRAEVFQDDIYPPAVGSSPAVSASEWFNGKEGLPPKISLQDIYEGAEPEEIKQEYKPAASSSKSAPTPAPAQAPSSPIKAKVVIEATKSEPKPEPTPTPAAARAPPPGVNENKASIATMASKYADDSEDGDEDDASSFEEVAKPADRSAVTGARTAASTKALEAKAATPTTGSSADPKSPIASITIKATPSVESAAAPAAATSAPASSGGPAEGLRAYLQDIKGMLETQNRNMSSQSEQIAQLTSEVNMLKAKLSEKSSSEKDERIRQLELELEEAKS